ncbi:Hypothetical protein NTJ_09953 [Nesidiocoris tenuis]|uniref:Uncharacterized protein n=1 Tax=Nesidiocoris tenuis TaxID=355587 RepID=A0ABN7B0N2_9HEMI|nr:Hypothetical protein NTJ_09953 [Nesidiocoris tenuis]
MPQVPKFWVSISMVRSVSLSKTEEAVIRRRCDHCGPVLVNTAAHINGLLSGCEWEGRRRATGPVVVKT